MAPDQHFPKKRALGIEATCINAHEEQQNEVGNSLTEDLRFGWNVIQAVPGGEGSFLTLHVSRKHLES